ncbi:helix-turn-helix transcriptional regulator [Aquimarina sp. AU119]|uniref:helix-turn-helix domain-containing protein n=1 Tax=Aquimarina sp. AU119 TaxID=2108528 RepID=UPI000D69F147|nr:helix-turn-helix transcriptional regulator [Aquimarina sp. AU119]
MNHRVKKIIETMDLHNISPYEVSQHTSLTHQALQKIKTGSSINPRSRTLDEIEEYLNTKIHGVNKKVDKQDNSTPFYSKDGSPASLKDISMFVIKNIETFKEDIVFKNLIDKEALLILLRAKKGDTIDIDLIGK